MFSVFIFFLHILTQSGAQFLQFLFYMMLKANFIWYHFLCEELYFLICCCFFKFDLTCDFQGREQFVYWRNPQVNALLPTMYLTTSWRKRHRLIHRQCWGKTPKSYHKLSIYGVPSWCTQNPKPLDLKVWHQYNGFFRRWGQLSCTPTWSSYLPYTQFFLTLLNFKPSFPILSTHHAQYIFVIYL